MKIVLLDISTLGDDIELKMFDDIGETVKYEMTGADETAGRISDADVVVTNKVKLNSANLCAAKRLKLICVTATGFDNIDTIYCRNNNIALCNVQAYSTQSVMQLTIAMGLSLVMHLREYDNYAKSGEYTRSGLHNYLKPVFYELTDLKWAVVGFGNIGKSVAEAAQALGAEVMVYKRTPAEGWYCTDIDTICAQADIISLHVPLNEETKGLISRERIAKMKKSAIIINTARGDIVDEAALADAIIRGRIGGAGIDVYSTEPFGADHPYVKLKNYNNVILTPHMAWGAYQSRIRCMEEVRDNIKAFFDGKRRNRIC